MSLASLDIEEIDPGGLGLPAPGTYFIYIDFNDGHIKTKDNNNVIFDLTLGGSPLVNSVFTRTGAVIAVSGDYSGDLVDFNPSILSDWTGSADPGQVDDALDQLASRLTLTEVANIFGQDYQPAESLGLTTTTLTAFQTKIALTTPALTGTYRVGWACTLSSTNDSGDCGARLQNITDATTLAGPINHAGSNTDVEESAFAGGFAQVVFSGVAKTFEIQFNRPFGLGTAQITDARLEFYRVS